jgi:predicted esterase
MCSIHRPIRVVRSFGAVLATTVVGVSLTSLLLASNGQGPAAPESALADHSRVMFTERSPFSSLEEVCRAMEIDAKVFDQPNRAPATYDLANESFDVFVPPTYRRNVPHGLLVYLSASVEPFPNGWLDVLRRHKLICVSPVYRGESGSTPCRLGLSLDIVHNMKQRYDLDDARVYVGGYSAGATVASQLVRGRPDVFRGGLLLMGGPFYASREVRDGGANRKEARDPIPIPPAWKGEAEVLGKHMTLVLVRGEGDTVFRPEDGRADAEALTREGFERVTLLTIPRQGHRRPNGAWFEKAVAALSAPPTVRARRAPGTPDARSRH